MATVDYHALLLQDGLGSTAELGFKMSPQVLPKLFEVEGYLRGYMIDGTYEAEGQNVASIGIPTLARPTGHFEDMDDPSYDPFTVSAERMKQNHIQLNINKEYRKPYQVAEDQIVQNIIGGSIVTTLSDYLAKHIGEEINRFTANNMVKGSNQYNSDLALVDRKIEYVTFGGVNPTYIPSAIAKLKAKIGNADDRFGDSSFNSLPVSAVISNTMEAELLGGKNQFILESSYGQEILVEGTFGRITLADNNAYRGKILGVNLFVLADNFFPNSTAKAGLFADKPTAGRVLGVLSVPVSTYRVFVDRGIKTVDAMDFRGIVLQPFYRLGIKVARPWGIGLLVSDDYVDANLQAPKTFDASRNATTGVVTISNGTASATYQYFAKGTKLAYNGAVPAGGTSITSGTTVVPADAVIAEIASSKVIGRVDLGAELEYDPEVYNG